VEWIHHACLGYRLIGLDILRRSLDCEFCHFSRLILTSGSLTNRNNVQAVMKVLSHASKKHTWFLPIFAVGLGAPRWCQMLWGTSSLAMYIPWAGPAGPYLGSELLIQVLGAWKVRYEPHLMYASTFCFSQLPLASLWLWLGVLDAVQGVGLGMILLQTLSRTHVAATLCLAQIIGSTAVIAARATAPNRIGPGNVFPDLGLWDRQGLVKESPLANWEFWVALASQLIIVAGYLVLFRREVCSTSCGVIFPETDPISFIGLQQLSKP
jgi:alpha-1,3-glucan synthase